MEKKKHVPKIYKLLGYVTMYGILNKVRTGNLGTQMAD